MIGYLPYFLFLLLVFVFCFLESRDNANKLLCKIGFCAILLFFFCILTFKSSNVGQDAASYEKIYNGARDYTFFQFLKLKRVEYLFYGLLFLFSTVFKAPSFIFWGINYSIITACLFFSFWKTQRPILSLSIYLLVGFFSIIFSMF